MNPINAESITRDGDLDCEASMHREFRALVERALQAGWVEDQIANALVSLAQTYALDLERDLVVDVISGRTLQ